MDPVAALAAIVFSLVSVGLVVGSSIAKKVHSVGM